MSASDYLEGALLNHLFNKSAYTAPTTFYLALLTANPADSATGSSGLSEATYTGYARKSFVAGDMNSPSGGSITNANAITFAACTAGSSTVTHFAILDAATNGNVLLTGALTASLSVSAGITPSFAAGALTASAD